MVAFINYNAFINDNFFDSGTIDGTNITTIKNTYPSWTIKSNIGQTSSVSISGEAGTKSITYGDDATIPSGLIFVQAGNTSGTAYIGLYKNGIKASDINVAVAFLADSTQRSVLWAIPLALSVPHDVYITQIVVTAFATTK